MAISDHISMGTSWERRKQTLAVFLCSFHFLMLFANVSWLVSIILCLFPLTSPFAIIYFCQRLFFDKATTFPSRGTGLRKAAIFKLYSDFFPVTLVKTAELDPEEKYVFGFHPHGIISIGAASCFATEGPRTLDLSKNETEISTSRRGFEALFPGLNRRLVTLPINFVTPFLREILLSLGMMASSKEAFVNVLAQGSGSSVVVVVGGADEAVETTNGEIRLVLEKRKGFVREAMKAGAKLVPVLAFGENDLYEVQHFAPDHLITQIQKLIKRLFTFSAPVFRGRSIFFRNFGLMPYRRPVFVTVGAPLAVPHLPDFDKRNEDHVKALEAAHKLYISSLVKLYDELKDHPLQPYSSSPEKSGRGPGAAFTRSETTTEIIDGVERKRGGLTLVK